VTHGAAKSVALQKTCRCTISVRGASWETIQFKT
jgi:hypothetical protein